MASSWIWHCKQQQSCFPSKQYWLTSLLPGVLLAASGLICYAFFETHDNYYYVHSVWHATMALAILCLLPPRREKEGRNISYETNCNFCNYSHE
ncbi:Transmembrane protein 8A [Portunus trituberculatus]|uniref:Transmembrane protein 8A n=1 Tax=Portunus trituberculatus TaxID=210409 RepID=A0A5B7I1N7_PORTR|nr:Transmembrane protein 8A [Portunus trituberculatus]